MTSTTTTDELRELIETWTGYDATTEPAFAYANDQACDHCASIGSTAVLSFDGESFSRCCYLCARDEF